MTIQAIEEVLADFGVHNGFRENRRRLAVSLFEAGFSADDVQVVADDIERAAGNLSGQAAILAATLTAGGQPLRDRVTDARAYLAAKAERGGKGDPKVYPGETLWRENKDRAAAQEREYQAFLARKKAGAVQPRAPHAWERAK